MEQVSLHQISEAVGGQLSPADSELRAISRIEIDSRRVQEGDLFWALAGTTHDGHRFVEEAFDRGAVAAVVHEKVAENLGPLVRVSETRRALCEFAGWYRNQFDAFVIGITGSFGKTTTREMIHAVLSRNFSGVRSPKNYNNNIGVPLSLLSLESQHEFAVFEAGASGLGEIAELCRFIQPEIGVITGIGPAHLLGFGSEEAIVRAKSELLESLPTDGLAVLAGDGPAVMQMASAAKCPVVLVGENEQNDLVASSIESSNNRVTFMVGGYQYKIAVPGRHFVNSALIAIAIAEHVGMQPEEIAEGLLNFVPAPGRSNAEQIGPYTIIDDSYNANPASVAAACAMLGEWKCTQKRIVVLGDMLELGALSNHFHNSAGRQAAEAGIENIIGFGEFADELVYGAHAAGVPSHRLAACDDWETLSIVLDCWVEPGDVILTKGSRSMRMDRVVEWVEQRSEIEGETNLFPMKKIGLRQSA